MGLYSDFLEEQALLSEYPEGLIEIDLSETLNEDKKYALLMNNTDEGRVKRAKIDVRAKPPIIVKLEGKDKSYLEAIYNCKAYPSTEKKRHGGYIIFHPVKQVVKQLWCDCKDFNYRLYAPYVKSKMATWDLPAKMKKLRPFVHNREWTEKTNPDGRLFLCKHLWDTFDSHIIPFTKDSKKKKWYMAKPEKMSKGEYDKSSTDEEGNVIKAKEPVKKSVVKPTVKPVVKPTVKPVVKPIKKAVTMHRDEPIKSKNPVPVNRPSKNPVSKPINKNPGK
jgi:hypothetical protein